MSELLSWGLVLLSVVLFGIASITVWWMLHAWRDPATYDATGFAGQTGPPEPSFSLPPQSGDLAVDRSRTSGAARGLNTTNDLRLGEPTMTDRPEFATSMRGYDRLQVDEYIDRLHDLAADAEERARVAESELEFSRHTTVGPRVAQILDLAVEEGKELRERVQLEADRLRADGEAEVEAIVAAARESADLTRTEAERTREEVLADADARRREVLSEVERLAESKAWLLSDLARLQRTLAEATGLRFDPGAEESAGITAGVGAGGDREEVAEPASAG